MGFYHPMTLVKDAQRHGVKFLPVDVTKSEVVCTLETATRPSHESSERDLLARTKHRGESRGEGAGGARGGVGSVSNPPRLSEVRLGLNYVTSLRAPAAALVVAERARRPFDSIEDFARRTKLHADELERLASIGAFAAFDRTRRDALWQVAALAQSPGPLFDAPTWHAGNPAVPESDDGYPRRRDQRIPEATSPLPSMSTLDRLRADIMGTDLTIGPTRSPVSATS